MARVPGGPCLTRLPALLRMAAWRAVLNEEKWDQSRIHLVKNFTLTHFSS